MQPHHRVQRPTPLSSLARSHIALLLSLCACGVPSELLDPVGEKPDPLTSADGGTGGTASPDPGPAPEPTPEPTPEPIRTPPGDALFATDQILEVRITLDPADQLQLEEHGDAEEYVSGYATLTGTGIEALPASPIGVRHKGAYTLNRCWDNALGVRTREDGCEKLSWKLKFDEFDPDQRVDGVKRLNLHSATSDDTRLRELMAYGLFRDFGVAAPRTAIAKVYVNDVLEGLFIAVEDIDGRFTKAHFPDGGGDGNLYKEIWPSPLLNYGALLDSLRTNEDVGDVSGFQQFADAVTATTPSTFRQAMQPWVDTDQLLRYIAVDRAIKNWDGIMAFYNQSRPHNFYWYHDAEGSGRFKLIPWDLDNTFWESDPYMAPTSSVAPVPDWNAEPANCNSRTVWDPSSTQSIMPPRCDLLLDGLAESSWSRFAGIAGELLTGPFDRTRLVERARHHAALLEPIVADDPVLNLTVWRSQARAFEGTLMRAAEDFQNFVAQGLITEPGLVSQDGL